MANAELSEVQIDVLKEIGNIGAAHAATSLAEMLGLRIDKSTPAVRFLDSDGAAHIMGGPETVAVAILDKLSGDLDGIMMFVIRRDFISRILEKLMGGEHSEPYGELELSAISEIGNIMVASYAGAVSELSGLRFQLSVPAVAIDMVGAIMNVPVAEMQSVSQRILIIEDDFLPFGGEKSTYTLFIPAADSLEKLLRSLGAGQ